MDFEEQAYARIKTEDEKGASYASTLNSEFLASTRSLFEFLIFFENRQIGILCFNFEPKICFIEFFKPDEKWASYASTVNSGWQPQDRLEFFPSWSYCSDHNINFAKLVITSTLTSQNRLNTWLGISWPPLPLLRTTSGHQSKNAEDGHIEIFTPINHGFCSEPWRTYLVGRSKLAQDGEIYLGISCHPPLLAWSNQRVRLSL